MRRSVGAVASGLGMFLVVFALALRFYIPGAAVKFPLSIHTVSTLTGTNMSYFNSTAVTEESGVTMHATNTTQGDVSAGNTDHAVYNTFAYLYDETNKNPVNYSTSTQAFDRRTGELLNCCGSAFGTDVKVHVSGQGLFFPFDTKKQTYQVFNSTLLKPVPARYVGTATVDGLQTYKFVSKVGPTQFGIEPVPGSLIGSNEADVLLGEYFQGTTSYWINPVTGVPVAVTQQQHVDLRDTTGAPKLVVLDGTLTTTPKTVQDNVDKVNENLGLLTLLKVSPLIAGIAGIILIIFGIVFTLTARREEYDEAEEY